jgi:hypothetical protein
VDGSDIPFPLEITETLKKLAYVPELKKSGSLNVTDAVVETVGSEDVQALFIYLLKYFQDNNSL